MPAFLFKCQQCGKCCWGPGTIQLSPNQILYIRGYEPCYFLKDNKCSIQNNKPEQCKLFPHWPSLNTEESLLRIKEYYNCPGIKICK